MARLRASESVASDHSELYRRPSTPPPQGRVPTQSTDMSPSPVPSSSDKENRSAAAARPKNLMGPPSVPASEIDASRPSKRRCLEEQTFSRSQSVATSVDQSDDVYDPYQSLEERRRVRRGFREIEKETTDNRIEWMNPNSTGLIDAVKRADEVFRSVKQTSDATLDSRILVSAGDLTHKKAQQTVLGDGAQGIDIDEFVSKCIAFMRADDDGVSRTQRRRPTAVGSDDEDEAEAGDAFDWERLGSRACFPFNCRPPVPGFLLGPLSLQKRARVMRQRRERQQRTKLADATRPQELKASDLEQQENASLTRMCKEVYSLLQDVCSNGEEGVDLELQELEKQGVECTAEIQNEIVEKHGLGTDGGAHLFRFALNPKSFGQSVENLFYVSFLVRDGIVGIEEDESGMPTLHAVNEPHSQIREENERDGRVKHQGVFRLDFETWEELVHVFNIQKPLIPTREDTAARVTSSGWYA